MIELKLYKKRKFKEKTKILNQKRNAGKLSKKKCQILSKHLTINQPHSSLALVY